MNFYKELNLPYPIKSNRLFDKINVLKLSNRSYTTVITDIEQYLNPELLDSFMSVGAKPHFFVAFGQPGSLSGKTNLHSDVTFENNNWTKLPIGINWDLTPGETNWTWWDTNKCTEIYPTSDESKSSPWLHGVHYKFRGNKDASEFDLLDSYKNTTDQAVMYRTDTTHQISYTTTSRQRICVSVRFPIESVTSWEHALKIFQPFFKLT